MEETHYGQRLAARIIDLLLVALTVRLLERAADGFSVNIIVALLLYSVVVALLNGKSLGKYLLSLEIRTKRDGFEGCLMRILREVLFFVLSPLILFNVLGMSPLPLHDRITGARVVRDEV